MTTPYSSERIAELRQDILSYKPGNTAPRDPSVFPNKLVIGVIGQLADLVVSEIRRVLHVEGELSTTDITRYSTKDQKERLTNTLSIVSKSFLVIYALGKKRSAVEELSPKVGCYVLVVGPSDALQFATDLSDSIAEVKSVTGRAPICAIVCTAEREDIGRMMLFLNNEGVKDIYELPDLSPNDHVATDKGMKGDLDGELLNMLQQCLADGDENIRYQQMCKQVESKQRSPLTSQHQEDKEAALVQEIRDLQLQLDESSTTLGKLTEKTVSLEKELSTELERRRELEKSLREKDEAKIRLEKEKRLLEDEFKREVASTEERVEQLERETWRLRTKIQLDSERRSAEQTEERGRSEWNIPNLLRWLEPSKTSCDDHKVIEASSGHGAVLHTESEPPDDEFGEILMKIADDLSDEAQIDSLGGQLGILQGDIQRAIKTNMRFYHITSDGTRHMLKQWRRGVSREDERIELRRALLAAKLVNLADQYLTLTKEVRQISAVPAKAVVQQSQKGSDEGTTLLKHQNSPYEHNERRESPSPLLLGPLTEAIDHSPLHYNEGVASMISDRQEERADRDHSQRLARHRQDAELSDGTVHIGITKERIGADVSLCHHGNSQERQDSSEKGEHNTGRTVKYQNFIINQLASNEQSLERTILLLLFKIALDVLQ